MRLDDGSRSQSRSSSPESTLIEGIRWPHRTGSRDARGVTWACLKPWQKKKKNPTNKTNISNHGLSKTPQIQPTYAQRRHPGPFFLNRPDLPQGEHQTDSHAPSKPLALPAGRGWEVESPDSFFFVWASLGIFREPWGNLPSV